MALPAIDESHHGLSETTVVRAAAEEEEGLAAGKGQRTIMRERALAAAEARFQGAHDEADDDGDDDEGEVGAVEPKPEPEPESEPEPEGEPEVRRCRLNTSG